MLISQPETGTRLWAGLGSSPSGRSEKEEGRRRGGGRGDRRKEGEGRSREGKEEKFEERGRGRGGEEGELGGREGWRVRQQVATDESSDESHLHYHSQIQLLTFVFFLLPLRVHLSKPLIRRLTLIPFPTSHLR